MDVQRFWDAVLKQDAAQIRPFFHAGACVNWHCTNEHFTVEEYIRANCEYPGQWDGRIERVEQMGDMIVTATNVFEAGGGPVLPRGVLSADFGRQDHPAGRILGRRRPGPSVADG